MLSPAPLRRHFFIRQMCAQHGSWVPHPQLLEGADLDEPLPIHNDNSKRILILAASHSSTAPKIAPLIPIR